MSNRIEVGDLCEVIDGLGRHKSPNLGLRVVVGPLQVGNHGQNSRFGPTHHCKGADVVQLGENGEYLKLGWADFPLIWLRKVPPDQVLRAKETSIEES